MSAKCGRKTRRKTIGRGLAMEIKMNDVFDLPFSVEKSGIITDDYCMAVGEFCGTLDQSKAAIHAINNHDILVEENEDLRQSLQSSNIHNRELLKYKIENEKLKEKLIETAEELNTFIDHHNDTLEASIRSSDLDAPEYHDKQTVHEAMVLAKGEQP
jgi:hypothetical protein